MVTVKQMEEIVKDFEKKLINLEKHGCDPLSKKYLDATNKYMEQKNILEKLKKEKLF